MTDGEGLQIFTPYGRHGASSRVRVYDWLDETKIDATVFGYAGLGANRIGVAARHPVAVLRAEKAINSVLRHSTPRTLVHREIAPFMGRARITQARRSSEMLVYDFDDALMIPANSRMHRQVIGRHRVAEYAVEVADRVIAGSEVLADWASQHNTDVRLLPSCVHPEAYTAKQNFDITAAPRILWLGSSSTEKYLLPIIDALGTVHRLTGARLIVASGSDAPIQGLEHMMDRTPWFPGIEAHLSAYDLAIAPLDDGLWERGKCAYKVVQYGAAGLPAVVSPVGANLTAAVRLGYATAARSRDWVEALLDLIGASASERATIGRAARNAVEGHYSYRAREGEWLDALGLRTGVQGAS